MLACSYDAFLFGIIFKGSRHRVLQALTRKTLHTSRHKYGNRERVGNFGFGYRSPLGPIPFETRPRQLFGKPIPKDWPSAGENTNHYIQDFTVRKTHDFHAPIWA